MSNHITIWIVCTQEIIVSGFYCSTQNICDFCRFHPWTLFKRNYIGFDFNIIFQLFIQLFRTVTIPEVRHMSEFLCFTDCIFTDTVLAQLFRQCILDFWRICQEIMRDVQISIILQHSGKHHLRHSDTVELVKAFISVKRQRDFLCAVTTEVEQYNAISILNRTDWRSILRDNESRQILIYYTGFCTIGFNCFLSRRKFSSFSKNVHMPSLFNHCPVRFVTVHGNGHTAATTCNAGMEAVIVQLRHVSFYIIYIGQCACFRNITSIQ